MSFCLALCTSAGHNNSFNAVSLVTRGS